MSLTGKYHTQFRDYDPLHCKWLSRDPIAEAGGVNLTGYCGNNPLGGVDDLGLRGPEGVWDVVGTPGLWLIGFGQGLWGQVTGIGHLLRQNPIDTIKGVGSAIWNYGDTYGAIKQMVNEELDAADASYAEMVMLEGRITAEVASLFIGVGELSALAKGGKLAAALSKANLVVKAKVAASLGRAAPVVKAAENVVQKTEKVLAKGPQTGIGSKYGLAGRGSLSEAVGKTRSLSEAREIVSTHRKLVQLTARTERIFQRSGQKFLTQGESRFIQKAPWARRMFEGTARDRILKSLLRKEQRTGRLGQLSLTPQGGRGIDVFVGTRYGFDLTTTASWARHVSRYKSSYDILLPLLYR